MSSKLLLVEDDLSLRTNLVSRLTSEGFVVAAAANLDEARGLLQNSKPELVILDLGLPDGSGFELAREIKAKGPVPLIFLTAWNTAENRLEGYELGAEEFIPKPFHFRELLLRVQHVLDKHPAQDRLQLPQGELDLNKMCFKNNLGAISFFARRDFQVLQILIEQSPKVLSRDEILNSAWGEESYPSQRTVDNTIVRLRQILKDEEGHLIRSVRGVGYQWVHE